jgi:hypothetical protein
MEFGAQNQYEEKKYTSGSKRAKILQSPKTEFGLQNQYDLVTYPSIGNFTKSEKKYTFWGQKGKNKPSEPKNGTS